MSAPTIGRKRELKWLPVDSIIKNELNPRSETAFRQDAEKRALEQSVASKTALREALTRGNLENAVRAISTRRRLALFVLDRDGRPTTPVRASQTELASVPRAETAIREALAGKSYVRSYDEGRITVVALPMRWESAAALLTYSLQPGYGTTMMMIRDQIAAAVLWAVLLGGLAGLMIAILITRRLHRIERADTVAFLDIDAELLAPRYRAAEQAMGLLMRGARRAGRRADGGRLLIQTFLPRHEVLQAALLADPGRLVDGELARRALLDLPPFAALAAVSGSGRDVVAGALRGDETVRVGGDDPVLVRAASWDALGRALQAVPRPKGSRLRVAVDPPRV